MKSGYGLETAAELRSLEAIRDAAARHPVTVVPTFLGAHEVPVEHRADRSRYLDLLVERDAARRGRGAASPRSATSSARRGSSRVAESRRILEAARDRGLGLRVHADELVQTGGAELAAEMGASLRRPSGVRLRARA